MIKADIKLCPFILFNHSIVKNICLLVMAIGDNIAWPAKKPPKTLWCRPFVPVFVSVSPPHQYTFPRMHICLLSRCQIKKWHYFLLKCKERLKNIPSVVTHVSLHMLQSTLVHTLISLRGHEGTRKLCGLCWKRTPGPEATWGNCEPIPSAPQLSSPTSQPGSPRTSFGL